MIHKLLSHSSRNSVHILVWWLADSNALLSDQDVLSDMHGVQHHIAVTLYAGTVIVQIIFSVCSATLLHGLSKNSNSTLP